MVRGESHIDCGSLSDPVLRREDGSYLYTLPSVVDDIELGVTHVIRGEDHVTNTAVQIQLFEALGGKVPEFGHHNLLTDAAGEGLSKRTGALSIASLRERGVEALAVAALAVLVGSAEAVRPVGLARRARRPRRSRPSVPRRRALRRGRARRALRAHAARRALRRRSRDRLAALGVAGPSAEAFWLAVRGNVARLADAAEWRTVVEGDIAPVVEDPRLSRSRRRGLCPRATGTRRPGAQWTKALKAETGRKGRDLYHPLRLALTARESGPELAALLPLIGRARALARLSAPSS